MRVWRVAAPAFTGVRCRRCAVAAVEWTSQRSANVMAGVRKLAVPLIIVATSVVAVAPAASVAPGGLRTQVGRAIRVRIPPGWDVVRGWLSDVIDPIPRLAVGSFPATLSRHTCVCGMPNVQAFPRAGAFLFIWEYPNLPRRELAKFPPRPTHFHLTSDSPQRYVCGGPSDSIAFQEAGRAFQADIYLGAGAGPQLRARLLAVMDSLRVAP